MSSVIIAGRNLFSMYNIDLLILFIAIIELIIWLNKKKKKDLIIQFGDKRGSIASVLEEPFKPFKPISLYSDLELVFLKKALFPDN